MSILRATLALLTRPRSTLAALELVDALLDGVEDLSALKARMGRSALSGDLDDSLGRLMSLKRK